MKRFYVGAKHIGNAIAMGLDSACMMGTPEQAIEDAKAKIRRGEVECAVVVQVIAVVRKEHPPIVVEYLDMSVQDNVTSGATAERRDRRHYDNPGQTAKTVAGDYPRD